jgi:hypothetical protein
MLANQSTLRAISRLSAARIRLGDLWRWYVHQIDVDLVHG